MTKTKIEWADRVWNPVTGCTKVSAGCDNCYAENIARRFAGTAAFPQGFAVTLHEDRIEAPLRWTKPWRVFVNSMSDLFHDQVPDLFLERVFDTMEQAGEQTFLILTKRHGRMRSFLRARQARREDYARKFENHDIPERRTCPAAKMARWRADNPPANIWVGVSVEDQKAADLRVPALLETPAAVRFLSCEPLLGPVDLARYLTVAPVRDRVWCPTAQQHISTVGSAACTCRVGHVLGQRIDWVIVGGESGAKARPMHPDWARGLRDQCESARVPLFFKQWGEWAPIEGAGHSLFDYVTNDDRCQIVDMAGRLRGRPWPGWKVQDGTRDAAAIRRYGKTKAGRLLDDATHDDFPTPVTAPRPSLVIP